jgi:dihydroxyacetone kinase-like predicted kinase
VADGRPLPEPPDTPAALAPSASHHAEGAGAEQCALDGGRYEVMYLLDAPDDRIDAFKSAWEPIGDSIVVVGGDGLWNCHIHTDDIGAAIEAALDAGRPRQIRVTDLSAQVEEEREVRHGVGAGRPHVVTAVVAVGAGDGVAGALRSLGAQEVVAGGQSANPSTKEILEAVEATDADAVVVLPNNKNVVPVAEGVQELASRPVRVVPTTSLVGGLAALLAYDPDADVATNATAMAEAAEEVVSGEVVRAVRRAPTPAGPVGEGDWLGIAGDEIVLVRPDLEAAATALLDRLVTGEHELVTVIEGRGATPEATEAVTRWLADERPGVEVQLHSWGQPHAAYVFSIE